MFSRCIPLWFETSDNETSIRIVHDYFESRHFVDGIEVVDGSYSVLNKLKEKYDFHIVTSRQHVIGTATHTPFASGFRYTLHFHSGYDSFFIAYYHICNTFTPPPVSRCVSSF